MKYISILIVFFELYFILNFNVTSCFQLKRNTPFYVYNRNIISCIKKNERNKKVLNLEKSVKDGKCVKNLNINKNEIYKDIESYLKNDASISSNKNNDINNLNDITFTNFVSISNDWNNIVIEDGNNKDIRKLTDFLFKEYKRAYAYIDEKARNINNIVNSEKIKSLLDKFGSILIDDMNIDEFYKHIEMCFLLLNNCKDNYISFSLIKNEIINIVNQIIKHSQKFLRDEQICKKMKNDFMNIHNLIKEIKKNDIIKMNIKNFMSVINSNIVLNNNNIFYFLTEIFSSLNFLMKDNPQLIYEYDYVINPHFFFLCIFSLYSYNLSKTRFYYFLLLIHNKFDLKENVAKYDDNMNYNRYKNSIINIIFEREKKEYESIKEIIVQSDHSRNTQNTNETLDDKNINIEQKENKTNEDSVSFIDNNNKEEASKKIWDGVLFKELYDNILIKILFFYIFFYFGDHYFCIILLLNFKYIIEEENKHDDNIKKTINYCFFLLLDNLYHIRDYSKIILLLSLYKNKFNTFNDKHLNDVQKIFNSVINNINDEECSVDMSKLLLEIKECIKNVENERNCDRQENVMDSPENKKMDDFCYLINKNEMISKEEIKSENVKAYNSVVKEDMEGCVKNLKNGDNNLIKESQHMNEKFNSYLFHLLKNKKYEKIEQLEKRDNLYVNNKTYSLFIQSFLGNHKYDKVHKVYKKMKQKKNIPIKYLNAKHLIHSFKNCDIDKGDVLNELQLINKIYLNLYFSKDSYFVLTKTLLYKHMCDYLKKKCEMKIIIDIFNINELLKYFIKFKSFINIKKLYFILLRYSYIKTYKTYLILIRFFNNLNYENNSENIESDVIIDNKNKENSNEENVQNVENVENVENVQNVKNVKNVQNDNNIKIENCVKCALEKNNEIYNDIINLRKKKLYEYIYPIEYSKMDVDFYNKIYDLSKKDKYDMSLIILSNFITEYILSDYSSDDIVENEYENIENILNIFFESINLFFYKQDYKITLNIYFFLLLFLNNYVTRYIRNDMKYWTFLKKNMLNFFLSGNYEVLKNNKDLIYEYIPNFILNIISLCIKHLKNIHTMKDVSTFNCLAYNSYDVNKNMDTAVNYKNIMYIFFLLKNNLYLHDETMEIDIYDKQTIKKKIKNSSHNKNNSRKLNCLYKDVIEKNYKEENNMGETNIFNNFSNSIANVFVKLKYTIGSDKKPEHSLKDFLFNRLKMLVSNISREGKVQKHDSIINLLKDIFFTYSNIIYLNSNDFVHIYEKLSTIYDNVLSVLSIIIFNENKNFKENNTESIKHIQQPLQTNNEINIHNFITMFVSMNKNYFKDLLNQKVVQDILRKYGSFIQMCIYFDLKKKKVDNIMNLLELSRKVYKKKKNNK